MSFKTIAVVGAAGSVGKPVVQALVAAGFKVTAVARESSTSTYPDGVEVRKADLKSVEALTKAFAGQDVVIMTPPTTESGNQAPYIDAAVAAGVKRFIPSEWGHNTRPGKLSGPMAEMMSDKTRAVDYLIEKAKQHPGFTWTGIATRMFLDWCLANYNIFGIDFPAKTAMIVDSGNARVATSSLPFVAESVVAVLQRADQTANRYVEVVEHHVTQNQLVRLIEDEAGIKLAVTHTNGQELARIRDEKRARGDWTAFIEELQRYSLSDGVDHSVKEEETANAELGLQARDVREIIREFIKSQSA
ncbi:isoflavone reductase [Chaetomium strumarium]|uniref:Isoflavone reductase n=1 Tax=Chaetomium strumarium TaxID=1170767 RepID=A0AAJ0GUA8_9PEZI|nr:isoflavone reductase [Chaetomium strumarium]